MKGVYNSTRLLSKFESNVGFRNFLDTFFDFYMTKLYEQSTILATSKRKYDERQGF